MNMMHDAQQHFTEYRKLKYQYEALKRSAKNGVSLDDSFKLDQECFVCGRQFASELLLSRHFDDHLGVAYPGEPRCALCGKTFRTRSYWRTHMMARHTGERPYRCRTCGRRFTGRWVLRDHERSHAGERPYACATCGRRFTVRSLLAMHERVHTGARPYGCRFCGRRFTVHGNRRKHERLHTGERPYGCDLCPKRFTTGENARSHRLVHARRPYLCAVCSRTFEAAEKLSDHYRRVHYGDTHGGSGGGAKKFYACDVCEKARFDSKAALAAHRKRMHRRLEDVSE